MTLCDDLEPYCQTRSLSHSGHLLGGGHSTSWFTFSRLLPSRSFRFRLLRTAGLMTSHVGRVRECRQLDAEGVPPAAAADRLKRNRYYVQKLYEQAGNFSEDELDDAIVRLARLDHALKGGSKLPGELEFTRALIDVSRATAAT